MGRAAEGHSRRGKESVELRAVEWKEQGRRCPRGKAWRGDKRGTVSETADTPDLKKISQPREIQEGKSRVRKKIDKQ